MLAEPSAEKIQTPPVNAGKIMHIGMGFWSSQALLTAVSLELFTLLAKEPLPENEISRKLGLNCSERHVYDWLDTLVSLGLLERKGLLKDALYSNAEDTDLFLDKNKKTYMGGILEMAKHRLYGFWGSLEEGLRTGVPQNESKDNPHANMEFFNDLYKDEKKLQEFINAMSGIQMGNFIALVNQFDFSKYKTMVDLGGADGWLSIQVCLRHPKILCTTFDLPPVEPLAKRKIKEYNLSDRIQPVGGDLLKDDFPKGDILTMGNILHGMDEETKQQMVNKAYQVLPEGGAFMAIENVIDNDRRKNTMGMLMSLNMLIENGDGFDYTMADFERWAKTAGFKRVEQLPLAGPTSAAIAYK